MRLFSLAISLTVLATVFAAPADLTQQTTREVDSSALREAVKTDLNNATTRLRASVSERMTAFQSAGETAKADALKRLDDDIKALQARVESFQPKTKTGQVLLDGLRERLTRLETTFNEQYKATTTAKGN